MSEINYINLENCDFTNIKELLNSPRSIESCYRHGIQIKDLYYKDFLRFKLDNPGMNAINKESQLIRWKHIEMRRNEYIELLKQERDKLIQEEEVYQSKYASHSIVK